MVVSVASALRLMECTQPYSQAAHQEQICQVIFFLAPSSLPLSDIDFESLYLHVVTMQQAW